MSNSPCTCGPVTHEKDLCEYCREQLWQYYAELRKEDEAAEAREALHEMEAGQSDE